MHAESIQRLDPSSRCSVPFFLLLGEGFPLLRNLRHPLLRRAFLQVFTPHRFSGKLKQMKIINTRIGEPPASGGSYSPR